MGVMLFESAFTAVDHPAVGSIESFTPVSPGRHALNRIVSVHVAMNTTTSCLIPRYIPAGRSPLCYRSGSRP